MTSCILGAQRAPTPGLPQYNVVIRNGTIIDGTGGPRYRGDLAVTDGRVVQLERGTLRYTSGARRRNEELKKRLANPALKDSITRGVIEYLLNDRGGGDLKRVQFARVSWDHTLEGRTLYDWAVRRKLPTTPEAAAPLVIEGALNGGASMVFHVVDEGDVKPIMAHPMSMIASDGRLTRPGEGVPHPRSYGTFPRVLGHYVRDENVLTLEQAVHKMTGMPAARLGLADHGCLHAGCVADIAIFDAAKIRDAGTFEDPHHCAEGIP